MKVFDASKMREMDEIAYHQYGIPLLLTMSKAAESLMDVIKERDFQRCLIVCGSGNNGGDGLALATLLQRFTSVELCVILVGDSSLLSETSQVYLNMCEKLEIKLLYQPEYNQFHQELAKCDVLVDCIFGFGLNRKIEGYIYQCIVCMNQHDCYTISCDIPSGIGADDGKMYEIAVKADLTVTFQNPKLGLYLQAGRLSCGQIKIVDLGIPQVISERLGESATILSHDQYKKLLPKRMSDSHKGDYGKVLLVGGSMGMGGALKLAVKAALKTGCGLTYMAFPSSLFHYMSHDVEEAMCIPCEENHGHISATCERLMEMAKQCDVIAFGNGMGRSEDVRKLLSQLLLLDKAMVIDADGLWALKDVLALLKSRKAETVLTPHDMELSRLIGCELTQLQVNRYELAKKFTQDYPITLVAKGMNSLVIHGEEVRINRTGNNSLSKGGSGDVLVGIISGLLAQNKNGFAAASLGVYLHGLCADMSVEHKNVYSSTPTDIIDQLPNALNQLIKTNNIVQTDH